jgi:hypothetical protein
MLSELVQNKQHLHVKANQLGLTHIDMRDLLKEPEYSDIVIDRFQHISGAISDLVYGLDEDEQEFSILVTVI